MRPSSRTCGHVRTVGLSQPFDNLGGLIYQDLFHLPRPAGLDVADNTEAAPGCEDFDDAPLDCQAVYIIEDVLRDRSPRTEPARQRLRAHISSNPGRPERALREHLMESLDLHAQREQPNEPGEG